MAIPATTVAAAGSAVVAAAMIARPDPVARALSDDPDLLPRHRRLTRWLGARDLAVSAVVLTARTPAVRTTGVLLRVALDLGDTVLLPRLAGSSRTRRAIVGVALTSAALHLLTLAADRQAGGRSVTR